MTFKYLKDKQEYIDRYDLFTIKNCLNWIEILKGKVLKDKKEINDFKLADPIGFIGAIGEMTLYFRKGEEYRNKDKTINMWMEKDREEQDRYDNAKEPNLIFCPNCNWAMEVEDKVLYNFSDETIKVLFFFECPKCKKRKGIFDNGEEYKIKISKCPECGKELKEDRSRKKDVITTIEICECGYKHKDVWDLKKDEENFKKEREKDKYLLEKFRDRFCLSEEEGKKYIESQSRTENYLKTVEEQKKKEDNPKYQKAIKLKKLKVFDLQKLLKGTLETEKYVELSFDKPEIARDVIIPFSVQESNTSKSDYDSQNNLKKLIIKTLEDTNWRLMSDGISQRLGILSGRIRGYENEEDLMKIVK